MSGVELEWNELWREVEDVLAHTAIGKWKDAGGKVVGWLCTYTPEEVIHAAGLLPVRLRGDTRKASLGDAYLQSNMCPYARSCIGGGALVHLAHLVAAAGVEEDALSDSGLARVDVGADADVSYFGKINRHDRHALSFSDTSIDRRHPCRTGSGRERFGRPGAASERVELLSADSQRRSSQARESLRQA